MDPRGERQAAVGGRGAAGQDAEGEAGAAGAYSLDPASQPVFPFADDMS